MKALLTIVCCLCLQFAHAQNDKQFVIKGNEFYKKQDYGKAAEQYKLALAKNDKNVEARYNLGNALYKSKKAEEAQKAFEGAAEVAGSKNMKGRSSYNKGVVLTRENKLQESIEAYKQSLRQTPTDEEARENLQKAINELKKQDQKQDKNDQKNKDQNQDQKQDQKDQQKNKSNISQKQAEKMLNAVRQEEKKQMQDKQKSRTQRGGSPEKDW